jgi:putative secretion ATPase (PEP-CTERM system associated)
MYEEFYNLKAKPFRLSPDPRFFFSSRGHKRALAYMRYGIKQGEGFIIITGDVGTGKTLLVSTLFQLLPKENVIGTHIVTTQMRANDLLRMVASGFGLSYERVSKAALLRSLESYFRACTQEGKRVLLVVDECQGLARNAIEELRMLSNFQMKGRPLVQSFLLGQREFRTTMRSEGFEQLRQRVIAAYHLRPLDAAETQGYIEHRLGLAGWNGDPGFTEDVFGGIYEFTDGVPRRINTLMDRLLLYGYLEEVHAIDREALNSVANDIIEEQGGVSDVDPMPMIAPPEEPSLQIESDTVAPPSPPPPPVSPTPAPSKAKDEPDNRLAAVEQSMSDLTGAVREELALLRKALLNQKDPDDDQS